MVWAVASVKCYLKNIQPKVVRMGMKDQFGRSGKAEQLLEYFKMDSQKHYRRSEEELKIIIYMCEIGTLDFLYRE